MSTIRLKDVAEACKVSVATVSRVLNGHTGENSRTAAVILRTARELGYVPNAAAQTLKTSRSNNIGIVYENRLNHEYFGALLDDLRLEARNRGYDITLICGSGGENGNYYGHACRRNLDGVIVIQADYDSVEVVRLATSSMPSVIIDHFCDGSDCVSSDNRGSMAQIVRYAWELGHRRIACITGEKGAITRERLTGFYKACTELGLHVPDGAVRAGHFHEPAECVRYIRELIREPVAATCVLCPDDYSCLGALWRLQQEGISVPGQVSLIGYDGIGLGQMYSPRLTTYRQDTSRIAAETLDILQDAIERPAEHRASHVSVKGMLVTGETVGKLSR